MKFKIILMLLFSYSFLICETNNDEKVVTAQQLMISINKFDTNGLVEISREKKITQEDQQQVLQNLKTEIQKNSGIFNSSATINTIRVFAGFICFYGGLFIAVDPDLKRLRDSYPNLTKISGCISVLGLWQCIAGAINLSPEKNRLNVLTIMEFYVKLIPVKN